MVYNFSEIKEQNRKMEDGLALLKKDYQKLQMPEEERKKLQICIKEEVMGGENRNRKYTGFRKYAAAAALIAGFTILPNTSATAAQAMSQIPVIGHLAEAVTFRNYQYTSERNNADIKTPAITVKGQSEDNAVNENLERTTKEINAEIKGITDSLIKEFKENLAYEEGFQDIKADSEMIARTDDYFTLKLSCYQGAGSGYEFNYYYTVSLETGERLQLKDIFKEGTDYITPISQNIKKQMKEQMDTDENVIYWLDNEIEDWNFKSITDNTSFYLDEKGQVVIGFNEGDVAPMYMGAVEFTIPQEALDGIRK